MSKTTKDTADFDFGQLMNELEEIVAWFDREDIDINQSLAKFERGMQIATQLKEQLSSVENKVQKIQLKFENGVT